MQTKLGYGVSLLILLQLACTSRPDDKSSAMPDTTNCYTIYDGKKPIAGISIETICSYAIEDTLHIFGKVEPATDHQVAVSVPMKGFLKSLYVRSGEEVLKGKLLAILENPDYARLQSEYLETKSQYDYLKQDYARQGELGLEHATSLKNVQKAQSDFSIIETKLYSLRKQLEFIGIKPDSVHLNRIESTIRIYAPISGTISYKGVTTGQLYTEESPLFQITDRTHLLVSYSVPQEMLVHFNRDDSINFYSQNRDITYIASIISSVPVENADGDFTIYAEFNDPNRSFSPGMKVNSCFEYSDSAYMVPRAALVRFSDGYYLYGKTQTECYKLFPVVPGKENNNMIEIINYPEILLEGKIVTAGLEKLKMQ